MADVYVIGDQLVSLKPLTQYEKDIIVGKKFKKHTVLEGRVSVMNSSART